MVTKFAPVPVKAFGAEISKILRKITSHSNGEASHIARCAPLLAVWQTRGIAKGCTAHAECAGFPGHAFGEATLAPAKFFSNSCRYIISRFCHKRMDGLFDADALAWL